MQVKHIRRRIGRIVQYGLIGIKDDCRGKILIGLALQVRRGGPFRISQRLVQSHRRQRIDAVSRGLVLYRLLRPERCVQPIILCRTRFNNDVALDHHFADRFGAFINIDTGRQDKWRRQPCNKK